MAESDVIPEYQCEPRYFRFAVPQKGDRFVRRKRKEIEVRLVLEGYYGNPPPPDR
jgi:hypothetical protein